MAVQSTYMFLFCLLVFHLQLISAGKSEEKCIEYEKLSRQRRDTLDDLVADIFESSEFNYGKIVTTPGEFPHMAALYYSDSIKPKCGGILISEEYVLTSAVCTGIFGQGNQVMSVRLGQYNISSPDDKVQEIAVAQIIQHPDYKRPSANNDIALLKLEKKATFTDRVRPACLHTDTQLKTDEIIATGWGRTSQGSDGSDVLLKVKLDLYTNEECGKFAYFQSSRRLKNGVDNSLICAGGRNAPKSTCQGDSGGPYQILHGDSKVMYDIVGIISFGPSCGQQNQPEAGTRVASFIPWIENIVWP